MCNGGRSSTAVKEITNKIKEGKSTKCASCKSKDVHAKNKGKGQREMEREREKASDK